MFNRKESFFYMVTLLSTTFVLTEGNDMKEEDRRAHSDRRGLWFGPRLGKRSVQVPEDSRDVYFRLVEAADALKYYYDQLPISYLERRNEPDTRVTKKVIFTPKLGRSLGEDQEQLQYVDFTPRLGRRLVDDMTVTASDQEIYRPDADRVGTRTRFFSPRLGRTVNFSPRLGRDINYDNYPDSVRVARSANDTKTSEH